MIILLSMLSMKGFLLFHIPLIGYHEHMKSYWECLTQDETEVDKRNLRASRC